VAAHLRNTSAYRRFWSRRRAEVVERDGCRCVLCRTSENLTAHHKIPWHISRDDSPCNLVTLCRRHHDAVEELDAIEVYLSWQPALIHRCH
jgi:HNH endonuclease